MSTPIPVLPSEQHIFAECLYEDTRSNYRVAPSDRSAQICTQGISVLPSLHLTRPDNTLQGYALVPVVGVLIPSTHTIEVVFRVDGIAALSIISADSGWSINVDTADALVLRTGVLDTPIGTINRSTKTKLAVSFSSAGIRVMLNNGTPITVASHVQNYGAFRFNHNQPHITNSTTRLELFRVRIWGHDRLTSAYIFHDTPLLLGAPTPPLAPTLTAYREETLFPQTRPATRYVSFSGVSASVAPAGSASFAVTRTVSHVPETRYVRITGNTPITPAYPVVAAVTFSVGATSVSRTVTLPALPINEILNTVNVHLDTGVTATIPVTAPALPALSLVQNTKFIDGYINTLTSIGGYGTATTTAPTVALSSFANAWYLNNSAFITLPATHSNVRTFVLIYKEQQPVSYRGYFGNTTGYTFNGGETGGYVGTLQTVNLTYTEVINISDQFNAVKLNYTGQVAVVSNATTNQIQVFRKVNNQWVNNPETLSLDLQAPTAIGTPSIDISADGTFIALGFKLANAGEGTVQVWQYINNTWYKDLHLGSPDVAPAGGFGQSVAISNDGLTVAVSEAGAAKVHVFKKNVIWSPVPTTTINGYGEYIAMSGAADVIAVSEPAVSSIRMYTGTGTLSQTLSTYTGFRLDRQTQSLVAFNQSTNSVAAFTKTTSWASVRTWSLAFTGVDIHAGSTIITTGVTVSVYRTSDNAVLQTFTKGSKPQYGSVISFAANTLLTSDNSTNVEICSSTTDALGSGIVAVRAEGAAKSLDAPLYSRDVDILFFTSDTNMTVNRIGRTSIGQHLDGLVLGALFYNNVLTPTEIANIESYVRTRFRLGQLSLA